MLKNYLKCTYNEDIDNYSIDLIYHNTSNNQKYKLLANKKYVHKFDDSKDVWVEILNLETEGNQLLAGISYNKDELIYVPISKKDIIEEEDLESILRSLN